MQFHVQNMTFRGCARSGTKAIQAFDPDAEISADPGARKVDVTSTAPRDKMGAALTKVGYAPA